MSPSRIVVYIVSVGLMSFGAAVTFGQDYPNKPIRIVTSLPGGGQDLAARLIAQGISGPLGQPVIVDNRPTTLQPEIVAKAPPDGYTLTLVGGSFIIAPLLQKTSYDPVRDFSPVVLSGQSPNVLFVHPSLPVPINSTKELIALAKAKPGTLNYASSAVGSSTHLSGELFKSMAGVNIVRIFYKSTGAGALALMSGETQLMIASLGTGMPHAKIGKLKALAVTSLEPSTLVPELPTIASTGLPGYEYVGIDAFFIPAKTPAAIINRLNREIASFIKQPDVREKFFNSGVEVVGGSPEQLAATVKSDIAKWGKVIKDAGIKIE